ncbi:hypothetical protein B0H12DRAFT_1122214 [Mycena haematopus]|nr:hypothetical protein B0H12DRAFT_1122214 [Mycena haematopus]
MIRGLLKSKVLSHMCPSDPTRPWFSPAISADRDPIGSHTGRPHKCRAQSARKIKNSFQGFRQPFKLLVAFTKSPDFNQLLVTLRH